MKKKKKKLSENAKRYNIVLICILTTLITLLSYTLIKKVFTKESFYKIDSRLENIEKAKSQDAGDYKVIGWIRVQGTNIDYPIYGELRNTFDYPVVSSPYVWSLNRDTNYHSTLIVYGHNVTNLGANPRKEDESFNRMESLMSFVYYDFAKENKYIQLSFGEDEYLYKIFAIDFEKLDFLVGYPYGEFSKTIKEKYLKEIKRDSIYDYNVDVTSEDEILSVATCTRFFGGTQNYNFIVTGRRVRDNEKVEDYYVSRNRNYEKVSTTMKGVDENE